MAQSTESLCSYTELATPPKLDHHYPKPHYYHNQATNRHYFVISRGYHDGGILMYNIKAKQYIDLGLYPEGFEPHCHRNAMTKNKLFVLGGTHQVHGIIDLNTRKWIVTKKLLIKMSLDDAISVGTDRNTVHLFGRSYGFDSDYDTVHHWKFVGDSLCKLEGLKQTVRDYLVYIEQKNELMLIGSKHICIYDLCKDVTTKWIKQTDIDTLSMKDKPFIELAFKWIIFVFMSKDGVWCLDLLSMKWYKSNLKTPKKWFLYSSVRCVLDKSTNELHWICCRRAQYHYKVQLFQFIPDEIIQIHQKRYLVVIYGYVHASERECFMNHKFVPNNLIQLILLFYPVFL